MGGSYELVDVKEVRDVEEQRVQNEHVAVSTKMNLLEIRWRIGVRRNRRFCVLNEYTDRRK